MTKIPFISYSHKQGKWVWERLTPVLRAAGCTELIIDRERFRAGCAVKGQMDAAQDAAEVSVLVLSAEYLASDYCRHELERALASDPDFSLGRTIPVVLDDRGKTAFDGMGLGDPPLWVDLTSDSNDCQWDLLLKSLDALSLGASAPHWLEVRDAIVRTLGDQRQSVNLVIRGAPAWKAMCEHIRCEWIPPLVVVDLDNPDTVTLEGLVRQLVLAFGCSVDIPRGPGCVSALNRLKSKPGTLLLAMTHFDNVVAREKTYGHDIFFALRYLVTDARKLTLLVESRTPFNQLLPKDHPLSNLHLTTVELLG